MKKSILIIFAVLIFLIVGLFIANTQIPIFSSKPKVNLENKYQCGDDLNVNSRGYIYLHGFNDPNPNPSAYNKDLIDADPKNKGFLDFDYDGTKELSQISQEFETKFNKFISENNFDEVIIIGQSAGGIIAANSAHKLNHNNIELHTLASPLNGYHVSESHLDGLNGFGLEIGIGLNSFKSPQDNIIAFHHKTVKDPELSSACGSFAKFCNPLKIQNNNLEGSQEFYYPDYDHMTIMPAVTKLIINCQK